MKYFIPLLIILAVAVWGGMHFLPGSDYSEIRPSPSAGNQAVQPLSDNLVQLDEPLPESEVSSPLIVRGRARGTWFFEGSFPVILTDWDGRIIATVPAQAIGEWMTTDWVPFVATVSFEVDTTVSNRGALILQKDNPSGLPEHDDAREITVFFK